MTKKSLEELTKAGRPRGRTADKTLALRIDAPTLERLNKLAVRWQCSRGEAVRRLIKSAKL